MSANNDKEVSFVIFQNFFFKNHHRLFQFISCAKIAKYFFLSFSAEFIKKIIIVLTI